MSDDMMIGPGMHENAAQEALHDNAADATVHALLAIASAINRLANAVEGPGRRNGCTVSGSLYTAGLRRKLRRRLGGALPRDPCPELPKPRWFLRTRSSTLARKYSSSISSRNQPMRVFLPYEVKYDR